MTWHGDKEIPFQYLGMRDELWDLLKELAKDVKYWRNALHFMDNAKGKEPSSLTERQRAWLETIVAGLQRELDKEVGKEVFDER